MNRICNILVIVDPTANEYPAVTKGALLAEKLDARLELFVCETKASHEMRLAAHVRESADAPLIMDVKSIAESLAAPLRERGLDVTTETTFGNPLHLLLLDRTKRTSAELVVKDTHHHTLAQRTFLTNTDWELIRGCPVPLLLVKPASWAPKPRIVAAVDPGHVNDKPVLLDHCILELASAISQRVNGNLHVIHAFLPPLIIAAATEGLPPMAGTVSAEYVEQERARKLAELLALVSDYGVAQENLHLEMGGPGEVLPRLAKDLSADVIAMGAISRSGLKRVLIGSTAEDILERLACDALIVKTPNFAELLPF